MKRHPILFVAFVTVLRSAIADEIESDLVGIPCKETRGCTSLSNELKDSYCKDGYCICRVGNQLKRCSSKLITEHNFRPIGSLIHRSCKHDQDCNFRRGVCNTTISQCECQKNYVASSDMGACLQKASSVGSHCVDEKQCLAFLPNTTCTEGKCSCILGYHFVEDACYRKIGFRFPCGMSQECAHIPGSTCTDENVCDCTPGTVISLDRSRCLPVADLINGECNEDGQCVKFSYAQCVDRRCQCRYSYHYEADMDRCFISKGLDESCQNSYECYQEPDLDDEGHEKPIKCENNTCVCTDVYSLTDRRCVNAAATPGPAVLRILLSIYAASLLRQF